MSFLSWPEWTYPYHQAQLWLLTHIKVVSVETTIKTQNPPPQFTKQPMCWAVMCANGITPSQIKTWVILGAGGGGGAEQDWNIKVLSVGEENLE